MRMNSSTRFATLAALVGALACAGNKAKVDETAAAKDTTTTNTAGRDTTSNQPTPAAQSPSDTFLQNQGTGTPQDTAGYSGIERDTTHQVNPQAQYDTTGGVRNDTTANPGVRNDTTGAGGVTDTNSTSGGADTSGYNQNSGTNPSSTSTTGLDSSGMSKTGDTTGYSPSQQQRDSTSR